jgi:hypothetical protein
MLTRHSRAAASLALAFTAGLLALPACDKKKDTGADNPAPGPGSIPAPGPNAGGTPDATLPSPPGPGPHLRSTDARSKQISKNNLLQIGLALHNVHSAYNAFPLGIADATGKVGLSWRVAILPFIEQENLYKQFKLDEPWNSERNKKLITQMPKIYAPPGVDTNGHTYYRSFSGQGAFLPPPGRPGQPGQLVPGLRITSITDGTANTIAVAEAAEPVIWTKPEDLPFSPGKPPKLGGGVFDTGFHAVLCDGSVRFLPIDIDPKLLSNLIQTNDGNVVNLP